MTTAANPDNLTLEERVARLEARVPSSWIEGSPGLECLKPPIVIRIEIACET